MIYFDIETAPLPELELLAMMPEFDAPKNIKDPEKIKAAIAEKKADWMDKAALDPLTGKVLAIGLWEQISNGNNHQQFIIDGDGDEKVLLATFWGVITGPRGFILPISGFNIVGFDLPFLVKRSWKHGLKLPSGLRDGRYWSRDVIDVREAWGLGDKFATGSLDVVAKYLGVGQKNGDGKSFAELWEKDRPKAEAYLNNDVLLCKLIAERIGAIH